MDVSQIGKRAWSYAGVLQDAGLSCFEYVEQMTLLLFLCTLLIAPLGGLGVALAVVIVRVLKAIGGFAIPRLDSVTVGWPMLAFCFAIAIVAALLAGLLPAVRASQLDPAAVCSTNRVWAAARSRPGSRPASRSGRRTNHRWGFFAMR